MTADRKENKVCRIYFNDCQFPNSEFENMFKTSHPISLTDFKK
jgi:hypothetical protein